MKTDGQKKILIIEDEKALAHALSLKLTHEGFLVETTDSGIDGLALLEKGGFALLLCDLITPGMDGFSVLESLNEKKIKIPVMVMTNLNQEEDKKRAQDLGAIDFFVKSNITISEIVEKVKDKMHKS